MAEIVIDQGGMDALRDYVQERARKIPGDQIEDARRFAPVDTGALKQSGHVIRMAPNRWWISFGKGLPDGRAVFCEMGTRYMHPRPYIRPAMYRPRSI